MSVCPSVHHLSVRMIQLENRWTNLDEIWCGGYAIGINQKILFFSFLHSVMPTRRKSELVT
jgi:hypothetical protein